MPTIFRLSRREGQGPLAHITDREEFFGPLGVTNIRTFVDPQNPTRAGVLMDVPDMDAVMAAMETGAAAEAMAHDGVSFRDARDPRRGLNDPELLLRPRPKQAGRSGNIPAHSRTRRGRAFASMTICQLALPELDAPGGREVLHDPRPRPDPGCLIRGHPHSGGGPVSPEKSSGSERF